MTATRGFLMGRQLVGSEPLSLTIEVYIAGSFTEMPIVLTKTLKLGLPKKKQNKKGMLDSIPELNSTKERGGEWRTGEREGGGDRGRGGGEDCFQSHRCGKPLEAGPLRWVFFANLCCYADETKVEKQQPWLGTVSPVA
ncbi:hypothetical protein U1Q18_026815 [Sarracenia purpurea var. burkii]